MQRVLTSINIFRATFLKIRPTEEGLEFKLHRNPYMNLLMNVFMFMKFFFFTERCKRALCF